MINLINRPFIKRTVILVPVLLLAFYLRVDDVGNWPVRWDEAYSVWSGNMDIRVNTERTAGDVHPPHYIIGFFMFGYD